MLHLVQSLLAAVLAAVATPVAPRFVIHHTGLLALSMLPAVGEPITLTITEFCRRTGIGLTALYGMLKRGDIESVTLGRRRLIIVSSYLRLLERLRSPALAENPLAAPPIYDRAARRARAERGEAAPRRGRP